VRELRRERYFYLYCVLYVVGCFFFYLYCVLYEDGCFRFYKSGGHTHEDLQYFGLQTITFIKRQSVNPCLIVNCR
jgi:hypothetical protein